jgi:hypothetical protein
MRIIIAIFLILCRFWVGFKVLSWIVSEYNLPELHSISEIELYLVIIFFDTWVSLSQTDVDIKFNQKDD